MALIAIMKTDPLYLQVKQSLIADLPLWQMEDGSGRLPTLNELQPRYRASRPTISKALAALAAEGLLVKEAGRGTFALAPTPPAAAPTMPSRLTIGYLAPLAADLPQTAFRGIDRIARRRDCRVLMAGSGSDVEQEEAAVREMIAAGASGLILYPALRRDQTPDYLQDADLGVPLVLIDMCCPEQGHMQVVFDNKRAGYQMTQRLLAQGHRRIALIQEDLELYHPPLEARLKGFGNALRDAGLSLDDALIRTVNLQALDTSLPIRPVDLAAMLEPVIDGLLALPEPPSAVIACDDIMAIELIELLKRRGVRVPEEMAVTGFDNRADARHFQPAFPTTQPDFELMGEVACEALLERLDTGVSPMQNYLLPAPLLIRPTVSANGTAPYPSRFEREPVLV